MQKKCVIKDRCIQLLTLLILSIGMYSAFGNTRGSYDYFDLAAYQHRIKGVVADSNGIPIQGVNIRVKGTSRGTFTNNEGVFYMEAAPSDVLVFSYIGFKPLEVIVGNEPELSVVLEEDVTDLGAVTVNAGYYTVSEKERTGNISRVTSKDIELQPVVSPLQALQGRMPGVVVTQNSGVPGSVNRIQIRGQNSLRYEGNYPLYVIDGVPVNSSPIEGSGLFALGIDPLNALNLSNIASIEILKDADATSIYGSRGANGVVLITTKKGTSEGTALDVKIYSGIGSISNTIDVLNSNQYLEMRREAFSNDGITPTESNAKDLLLWNQNKDADWQEILLGGSSYVNDLQLAISGGSSRTSFVLGNSIHKETMVFPGDFGYRKITGSLNLNHRSADDRFKLSVAANYGTDKNKLFNDNQFVQRSVLLPPNAPDLLNEDGSLNWENETWSNPLSYLKKSQEIKGNNFLANVTMSYEITQGLALKSSFGYGILDSESLTKNPISSGRPSLADILENNAIEELAKRQSIIAEPQLLYNLNFNRHQLEILAGMSFQESLEKSSTTFSNGYADESLIGNSAVAENVRVTSRDNTEYRYNAIFGRVGYNWHRTYFINLTGRRDGSSRFADGNRFANFGAIGAAWIFTNEPFSDRYLPFLSYGKIRGSYGTTGNDQIADYGYLSVYEPTAGNGGLYPVQIGNPNYSWEVNKKLELSGTLGFFDDRINTSASWYRNRSSNQLIGYYLPATTGFSSIQANLPAVVENRGWELELRTLNIKSKRVNWTTAFSLTLPRNELLEFDGLEQSTYANTYRVGSSLQSTLLYKSLGVNPDTGLYEVEDVNGDGTFSIDDRIITADFNRQYYGGMHNSLTVGGFQLDFFLEFVKQSGNNELSLFSTLPGRLGFAGGNQPVSVTNRWQNPGDLTNTQRYSASAANAAYQRAAASDLSLSDASYLRLKTLTLSYTIPDKFISGTGMESCNIYLHGQNLITLTEYKGFDPENNRGSLLSLPPLKMFTFGIHLKF